MRIVTYSFDSKERQELIDKPEKFSDDWPVVYLIYNTGKAGEDASGDTYEMYVGETCSFVTRFSQHLSNPVRRSLKQISVIVDEEFNKSATLDIEQSLIQLIGADGLFQLQNQNAGQSVKHDYYQREMYINKLPSIWKELQRMHLASQELERIRNSDLFKYSPYISLTQEQSEISTEVLSEMMRVLMLDECGSSVIHGSAGTGKTIMAINMIFTICSVLKMPKDMSRDIEGFTDEQLVFHDLYDYLHSKGKMTVGFVVPMESLRKTMKKVFGKTKQGLSADLVIGPSDVVNQYVETGKPFDILFVDESHRLKQRKSLSNYGTFDLACRNLGMDPEDATQLDWIVKCSRYRILFYDPKQTIKGSDITPEQFDKAIWVNRRDHFLKTQLRCEGGDEYLSYIERIFNCRQANMESVENYDFRMFDDVDEMVQSIRTLNSEHGLCRVVAGYSWPWRTKKLSLRYDELVQKGIYDIEIDGHKYIWNMDNVEWIMRESSINEIGCIHTTQGYDLNYVGVIFGEEIDYNYATNRVEVDLGKFYDRNVKAGSSPDEVKQYIINAYKVMMTRGIKGCYVYVCNPGLRKYLKQFIPQESDIIASTDVAGATGISDQ